MAICNLDHFLKLNVALFNFCTLFQRLQFLLKGLCLLFLLLPFALIFSRVFLFIYFCCASSLGNSMACLTTSSLNSWFFLSNLTLTSSKPFYFIIRFFLNLYLFLLFLTVFAAPYFTMGKMTRIKGSFYLWEFTPNPGY